MIAKHAAGWLNLRTWIIGLAALCLLAQSLLPARSAEFVLKFGTATQNETQHQFIKLYKEALEAASHGRIEVQVYPNSQLGPIPREIEGVQLGTIQGYIGPVDFFVGVEPRYGVFSAPMLFRDEANVAATIHDPELQHVILTMAEPKRLVGLATLAIGAADYAAKRPLLRLADFEGKKLRINGTELERAKMSRLGASGIAMPLSEVMPALSQGAIDGTISGLSVFVAFKMNDLVKVITVTNDTMLVSLAVVSQVWLDKLPPDLRKVVLDTGRTVQSKAQDWQVEFTKQLANDWTKVGGEIHMLPPEDLAKMKTLLGTVGDEVTKNQPAMHDLLEKVRAIAARH
jgi:TRAP-type C4-dicarboxylate transport system substrate-binding protein